MNDNALIRIINNSSKVLFYRCVSAIMVLLLITIIALPCLINIVFGPFRITGEQADELYASNITDKNFNRIFNKDGYIYFNFLSKDFKYYYKLDKDDLPMDHLLFYKIASTRGGRRPAPQTPQYADNIDQWEVVEGFFAINNGKFELINYGSGFSVVVVVVWTILIGLWIFAIHKLLSYIAMLKDYHEHPIYEKVYDVDSVIQSFRYYNSAHAIKKGLFYEQYRNSSWTISRKFSKISIQQIEKSE